MTVIFQRFWDYFFLTRPIFYFPAWSTMILGFWAAESLESPSSRWEYLNQVSLGFEPLYGSMLYIAFAIGAGSVLNQIADIENDEKNQKLPILTSGIIQKRPALWFGVGLALLSCIVALGINIQTFLLLSLAIFWSAYMYNFKPFRFKDYPMLGLFANWGMGFFVFLMGYIVIRPLDLDALWVSLPYTLANTALYILTTIPDAEGDKADHKITITVACGIQQAKLIALSLLLVGVVTSLWMVDSIALVIMIFMIPFFFYSVFSDKLSQVLLTVKLGLFFLAIAAGIRMPAYIILIFFAYWLMRYYYRLRFDIEYPSFR